MVKNFIIDISESEDIFSKNIRVQFAAPYAGFDGRDYYQLLWDADGSNLGMLVIEENGNFLSLDVNKILSANDLARIYTQITDRENAPKARAEDFPFSINEFENSKLKPFSIITTGGRKSRKAKNSVDKTRQLSNSSRVNDD
jgi:hypothetical protein